MTYLPFKEEAKQQKTAKRILEEQNYQIILNELSERFEAKMADECGFERYLWKGTKEYKERFSKQNGETNKKIKWLAESKTKQLPILLMKTEKFIKKSLSKAIRLLVKMITSKSILNT